MENVYVFRVCEHGGAWAYEFIRQDIVLLEHIEDVERYREWLKKEYETELMVEVTVSRLEDHLEPDDEVQQRLLSVK